MIAKDVTFKVKEKVIEEPNRDMTTSLKEAVFIVRVIPINDKHSIEIPHPVSVFVTDTAEGLNTQKKKAYIIASFLNFVMDEIRSGNEEYLRLKEYGLRGLTLCHGSEFLKYSLKQLKNKRGTVNTKEDVIIQFFDYLIELDALEDKSIVIKKLTHLTGDGRVKYKYVSPFEFGTY